MRIVIKVGTSTLTHKTGNINIRHVEKLIKNLEKIYQQEKVSIPNQAQSSLNSKLSEKSRFKKFAIIWRLTIVS